MTPVTFWPKSNDTPAYATCMRTIPREADIIPHLHFLTSSSLPSENMILITMIKRNTIAKRVTAFLTSLAIVTIRYFAPFSPVTSPPKKNPHNPALNDSIYPSRVTPAVASPVLIIGFTNPPPLIPSISHIF